MRTINVVSLVLLGLLVVSNLYLTLGPCPFSDYASCGLGRGLLDIWISLVLIITVIILSIISFVTRNKSK